MREMLVCQLKPEGDINVAFVCFRESFLEEFSFDQDLEGGARVCQVEKNVCTLWGC